MFHDLLKTTLPSRKELKSCDETVEMWLLWSWMLKVDASCFLLTRLLKRHQRKRQLFSWFIIVKLKVAEGCCVGKLNDLEGVFCNYDHFMGFIFRKLDFLKNPYVG